ncbi:RNase H domain-containing protein [Trichonephila clavipes]|nr:RNase H domain-containing protein [Trichonephila clavipes]
MIEKALNKTLKGIAALAKDLKLTINADKTKYRIFSTDRRHRGTFNADIKIEDYNIKRVIFPTYLGVTIDSELRFTKHIEQTTIKALRKLNILRKLCGTTWGSRPRTLKNAYSTIIRPVLEYAAPIWAPASVSSKQKLESIQHRASKIIIGAVSSTKNEKAEREWGLPPLECRRNLATVKFTNKLRCYKEDHISTRVFNEWPYTKRLKRSSTLQLDEDIRIQINLEYSILNFMQEPPFPKKPPKETKITLNLLRPCSKKEDARILKQKGFETIEKISQENFVVVYTDGSSDISLNKGGAGILFQLPNKERKMHKINTGAALEAIIKGETNITFAINVLLESLHCKGKSCLLQWIPAHVNIEGNECTDSLAKEGRNDDQLCPTITLADANAVANYRLLPHRYKKPLIVDFDCSRNLTSILARLRTGHFKGMKIKSDKTRTYIPCKNCTEAQLTPDHILECPTFTPHIIRLGMVPLASELREVLYSADAPILVEAVQRAHDIM